MAGMAAANSSEVPKFLVELLMRQRSGRPYAVRQLDELDGSQAALPLQLEVRSTFHPPLSRAAAGVSL